MPLTDDVPKCYAEIGGRRILDWCLEAVRSAGLSDIVFVGGYRIDRVRADYPALSFVLNSAWEENNILASLFWRTPAAPPRSRCRPPISWPSACGTPSARATPTRRVRASCARWCPCSAPSSAP
jgi:hypothetical protein